MRIIGGTFKGRRFRPPADKWPTRPTTDFAKEGLFNILVNRLAFEDICMLDLFGGTGSHCYEFISRGCRDATYVDKFGPAVSFVRKTARELGIEDYLRIVRADVFKFIRSDTRAYDYIFAGPPYPLPNIPEIPQLVIESGRLTPSGLLVVEHNPDHDFKQHAHYQEERSYGTTIFSFFGFEIGDKL